MSHLQALLRNKSPSAYSDIVRCFAAGNKRDESFLKGNGVTLDDLRNLANAFSKTNCMSDVKYRRVLDVRLTSAAKRWSGYRMNHFNDIIHSYASSAVVVCPLLRDDDLMCESIQNSDLSVMVKLVSLCGQLGSRVPPSVLSHFKKINFDKIKISTLVKIITNTSHCTRICFVGLRELSKVHKLRDVKPTDLLSIYKVLISIIKSNNLHEKQTSISAKREFDLLKQIAIPLTAVSELQRLFTKNDHPSDTILYLSVISQLYSKGFVSYTDDFHRLVIVKLYQNLFRSRFLTSVSLGDRASVLHVAGVFYPKNTVFYSKIVDFVIERIPNLLENTSYSFRDAARVMRCLAVVGVANPKLFQKMTKIHSTHSSLIGVTLSSVRSLLWTCSQSVETMNSPHTKRMIHLLIKASCNRQVLSSCSIPDIEQVCGFISRSVFDPIPKETRQLLVSSILTHRREIFSHSDNVHVIAAAQVLRTAIKLQMHVVSDDTKQSKRNSKSSQLGIELDQLQTKISTAALSLSTAKAVPTLLNTYSEARWGGRGIVLKLCATAKAHIKSYSWKEISYMSESCVRLRIAGGALPHKIIKKITSSKLELLSTKITCSLTKLTLYTTAVEGTLLMNSLKTNIITQLLVMSADQLFQIVSAASHVQYRGLLPNLPAACCVRVESYKPSQRREIIKLLKVLSCERDFELAVKRHVVK